MLRLHSVTVAAGILYRSASHGATSVWPCIGHSIKAGGQCMLALCKVCIVVDVHAHMLRVGSMAGQCKWSQPMSSDDGDTGGGGHAVQVSGATLRAMKGLNVCSMHWHHQA